MDRVIRRNRIARKLIGFLVAFSSLVTVVTTGIQLYVEYGRDIESIDNYFAQVQRSYVDSVAENVWEVDAGRLHLLLVGIVEYPDIIRSEVRDNDGEILAEAGTVTGDDLIWQTYPLTYDFRGQKRIIGELDVVASLSGVYQRVIERVWLILVSNGLKTFLVAAFLFLVIHWLVTRHLVVMADFARNVDLVSPANGFALRRARTSGKPDEIDHLADSLNQMQHRLRSVFDEQQKSEANYRNILETLVDTFYRVDMEGKIIIVSPSAKDLLGYAPAELSGRQLTDLYAEPEDRKKFLTSLEQHGGEISGFETRLRHKDGSDVWVSASSHFRRDPSGEIVGIEGTVQNITERVQAETALKASEARLNQIIQIAPEAIITVSEDLKITLFNAGAQRIFGYRAEEVVGQSLDILLPASIRHHHREYVRQFQEGSETYRLMDSRREVTGLRKDGTEFPAAASVSKAVSDEATIFTVMLHDVSERRQSEEVRRKALKEAERANQAKSEFMASMSHELRTPLNSILGFAESIANQYLGPVGEPKYLSYARDILFSGRHLLNLVNQILDIERIEAGKYELHMEDFHLADVLAECERMMIARANNDGVQLDFDVAPGLDLMRADRQAILQVFLNVIGNAIKFTDRGGRVAVRAYAAEDCQMIMVKDTGIGIPAEKVDLVMQPFTRHENDPHKPQEGVGLGLAIANALVVMHEGEIQLQSEECRGTTVLVRLPIGSEI